MNKLILYFLIFFLLASPAFAHQPSSIIVQKDKGTNELVVLVYHRISTGRHEKNRTHFIKEIILEVNGKQVDSATFNYQNNPSIVRTRFAMPKHERNDELTVKAICSTGSELSSKVSIKNLPVYQSANKNSH